MILQKILPEELDFMESWHTPRCLIESLFSNFDNLSRFDENKLGNIRTYQFGFYSDEPLIDFETTAKYYKMDENQIMQMRKNVGDVHNYGARNFGKSLITEKVDIPISILHDDDTPTGVSSSDATHLNDVLSPVKRALENHPIVREWKSEAKERPNWILKTKNGWSCHGINMRIKGKDPGDQFYGKHLNKLWIEERSFESKQVADKRADSFSEKGAVERYSGMTNFTRHSPTGEDFFKPENKNKIINLPQYVNPFWTNETEKEREEQFNGKNSLNYLIYVEGEIVEDSVNELDMERVQKCYNVKKEIKRFEITKNNFYNFRNVLVVERPKNSNRIFVSADVGDRKITEIIIHSEVGNVYNYLYNITLHSLIKEEQQDILDWIIQTTNTEILALDCGDAFGRVLADFFEKKYSKDNVVRYMGQAKIEIGFEKDEKNNIKYHNGKPISATELMVIWSVHELEHLLYNRRINIPYDNRLDIQFTSLANFVRNGQRVCKCLLDDNHLFDAFKVFAIAVWIKKDLKISTPKSTSRAKGISSWATNK